MARSEEEIPELALRALEMVPADAAVGLGTGRAATAFIRALAAKIQQGFHIGAAVPTSEASASVARELGIPLADLESAMPLDITVDGADEVDPQLNLIKGYGGALVREKIVAAASRQLVILVGPDDVQTKVVSNLGQRGILPVEVIPFGLGLCRARFSEWGLAPSIRMRDGWPLITDNGNQILDCRLAASIDPEKLEAQILKIPGVVDTGFFLQMATTVLIQWPDRVEVR